MLFRSDLVDEIVTPDGELVDQIASNVHMIGGKNAKRRGFTWNGRTSDGKVAPDGNYDIKVVLVHQNRSVIIADPTSGDTRPVTVQTTPPPIRVTSVTGAGGTRPAVIPAPGSGPRARMSVSAASTRSWRSCRVSPPGNLKLGSARRQAA